MRVMKYGLVAAALLLSACGSDTAQRSSTGLLTGVGVGAAVGGPIGAAVGGAVGAAGGAAMPEGADTIAANALHKERTATRGWLVEAGLAGGSSPTASGSTQPPPQAAHDEHGAVPQQQTRESHGGPLVKNAQGELARERLYDGAIDGIVGPKTRKAAAEFQGHEGLPQTSALDDATLAALWQQSVRDRANGSKSTTDTGPTAPANAPAQEGGKTSNAPKEPGSSQPPESR